MKKQDMIKNLKSEYIYALRILNVTCKENMIQERTIKAYTLNTILLNLEIIDRIEWEQNILDIGDAQSKAYQSSIDK